MLARAFPEKYLFPPMKSFCMLLFLTFSFCQFSVYLCLLMKMSQSHDLTDTEGMICCFVSHCGNTEGEICLFMFMLKLSAKRGQAFQNIYYRLYPEGVIIINANLLIHCIGVNSNHQRSKVYTFYTDLVF